MQITRSPGIAWAIVALEFAKAFVTAWRFDIAFRLIDVHESYWVYLVLAAAASLAGFVAFTPGAFGFREVFMSFAAGALGVGIGTGFVGATVDRAVLLLTSVLFGALGFLMTYKRLPRRERRARRSRLYCRIRLGEGGWRRRPASRLL